MPSGFVSKRAVRFELEKIFCYWVANYLSPLVKKGIPWNPGDGLKLDFRILFVQKKKKRMKNLI